MDKRMKWTEKEKKYLKAQFKSSTYREIADHLGKSVSSVLGQAQALNIQGTKKKSNWSKKELSILNEKYSFSTVKELSRILKRTPSAVRKKMFDLELSPFYRNKIEKTGFVKKYIQITVEDSLLIEKHYGTLRKMIDFHLSPLRKN